MEVYHQLGLDKLDCCVAIIKNAKSKKMGKKDIIKIDGGLDLVDLDILGFIDHNITVNIIKELSLRKQSSPLQKLLLMLSNVATQDVLPQSSRSLTRYSICQMRKIRFIAVNIVKKSTTKYNVPCTDI